MLFDLSTPSQGHFSVVKFITTRFFKKPISTLWSSVLSVENPLYVEYHSFTRLLNLKDTNLEARIGFTLQGLMKDILLTTFSLEGRLMNRRVRDSDVCYLKRLPIQS